jgi:hypothetical protein
MIRRSALLVMALAAVGTPRAPSAGRVEKFRPCDGACCKRSPLRPAAEGADCQFRDPRGRHDVNSACRIMLDRSMISTLTEAEAKRFAEACVGYPIPYKSETMGEKDASICCWRNC